MGVMACLTRLVRIQDNRVTILAVNVGTTFPSRGVKFNIQD